MHHLEHPYEALVAKLRESLSQKYAHFQFSRLEDRPFTEGPTLVVVIGELLKTGVAEWEDEPYLFVQVGDWDDLSYFRVFPVSELEFLSFLIKNSTRTFYTDSSVCLEWVIHDSGDIVGIKSQVQSITSNHPITETIIFNPETLELVSVTKSENHRFSFTPSEEYVLPENIYIGKDIKTRERRTWETRGPLKSKIQLSLVSPLEANQFPQDTVHDYFTGALSISKNPSFKFENPSIVAEYRLVGESRYASVKSLVYDKWSVEDFRVHGNLKLNFCVIIERVEADKRLGVLVKDSALVARDRPLRLKFTLLDENESYCYLITEYLSYMSEPKSQRSNLVYFNNIQRMERVTACLEFIDQKISIPEFEFELDEFSHNKIVYSATLDKITEVLLKEMGLNNVKGKLYGLIDLSCKRIYSYKVIFFQVGSGFGSLGYLLAPRFGINNQIMPIQYANEEAQLSVVEPELSLENYVQDDDFDDLIVEDEVSNTSAASIDSKSPTEAELIHATRTIGHQSLEERLENIDRNLERTANAVENLTAFLKTLALNKAHLFKYP